MSHVEEAHRYARQVIAGKLLAGKWVRLACQRQLDDLKREKEAAWPYRFDRKKAERICNFIQLLPHTKGMWAARRETIVLQPWQKFILCAVFGWVHKTTKLRRFREVYAEIPRKNGKSVLAAGVGLYMFTKDNEFGAEVYSGATTEKQAWEIFRPARLIAMRTADLREDGGIVVSASNLSIEENGSRFEPLIGNPGDGASPSCVLIDEYHEHDTDALYQAMTTGMGARQQPLTFVITTAGVNLAGPCYRKRDYLIKVLSGTLADEELFGLIFGIDEEDDWAAVEALKKANPNYGVSVLAEALLSSRHKAMQSASEQNSFRTKHLNQWVGAKKAWMNMLVWKDSPAQKTLEELSGRLAYIGLDLASKIDVAAMILLFPPTENDPLYHVHGRYYLPEDILKEKDVANVSHYAAWSNQGFLTTTPGNVIDYDYIKDDLRKFSKQFEIKEIVFDPWQATPIANEMIKEGAPMVELGATVKNFSEPMKEVEKLARQKRLAHGNCPMLMWMTSNVVARLDNKDNIYPTKELPENKIDGPVALIAAMSRATLNQNDGSTIYNDPSARPRGIISVGESLAASEAVPVAAPTTQERKTEEPYRPWEFDRFADEDD